jgi:hypothetical protein
MFGIFVPASVIGGIDPRRGVFFGEVIFIVLCIVGVGRIRIWGQSKENKLSGNLSSMIIAVILVVLLFGQLFAGTAVADYPGNPRWFLNDEEVAATEHTAEYAPGSATDLLYHRILVDHHRPDAPISSGNNVDTGVYTQFPIIPVLQGEADSINEEHITIREGASPIRLGGGAASWVLHYDPAAQLARDRAKVYDNGDVSSYYKNK